MSKPNPHDQQDSLDVSLVNESSDSAMTTTMDVKRISKHSERNLSDRMYFAALLHYMGTDMIMGANFLVTLPTLISQYAKPEYFDINEKDIPGFNFDFLISYVVGNMIGGFLNSYIGKLVRTSLFRVLLRALMIALLLLALIPDKSILLTMRFFQGVFQGLLESNSSADAFKLAPGKLKGAVGNFFSFYFAIGVMIGEFLYYLSKKDIINWIWVYLILCLIELVSILLSVMYLGVDLSFTEYLERGDERTARQILERYVTSENADYMIKEELAFFEMDRVKRSMHSFAIQAYAREFFVGVLIYFFSVFSFANVYSSSIAILTCKNPKDNQEATDLSFYTTLAAVLELFAKTLQLFVPAFNRKRKRNLILGYLSISVLWALNGYFYYVGDWKAQKIMIVAWFFCIGLIIAPPSYSIMTDMLIGELFGVVNSLARVLDIATQYIVTKVLESSSSVGTYYTMAFTFSSIAGIASILTCIFFFETYGKTKVEIHNILYRIKQ